MSNNYKLGQSVPFLFTTHAAAGGRVDPSSAFEAADIRVYNITSQTRHSTGAFDDLVSPFDSMVGVHLAEVDTSDPTDVGFFVAGEDYAIVLYPDETVDGELVARVLKEFSIENRFDEVDLTKISGDTTAADNLKLQYDTTGLTGDTFPATQAQVGTIATGAGGLSVLITAFAKVGTEPETNTFEATQQGDGVYHIVEDDAPNTDFYYQATVSAGGKATSFEWLGYIQSNGDTTTVWYWDWAGTAYKQITTLPGSNGTTPFEEVFTVPIGATGTGADEGKVRLRFLSTTTTAIATDRLLCEFSQASQSVGYANGQIWVDSNSSNTNTVSFVDGVADNPVGSWADALTISAQVGLTDFHILNGSTIALSGNSDNFSLFGDNWTLQLEGQSIVNMHTSGAVVTGTSTGSGSEFHECEMGTCTIAPGGVIASRFTSKTGGGFTMQAAGDFLFDNCRSKVAGNASPVFTFPGAGDTFVNDRAGSGGRQYEGMSAGDIASVEGWGQFIEGTCSGGAVTIRGCLTTSGITNITITDVARFDRPQISKAVWDEVISTSAHNDANSAGRRLRQITAFVVANDTAEVSNSPAINQIQLASGESSVDGTFDPGIVGIIGGTALGQCRLILEYEGATRLATLNRDWKGTPPDATSEYMIMCTDGGLHVNEGLAQGGGASSVTLNSLASSADNLYVGQFVFLTSGPGQDQVGRVTAYNGTSKVATVETATNGWVAGQLPTSATGYIMIPMIDVVPTMIGTDGIGLTDLGGMSIAMQIEVLGACSSALSNYDAPKNTDIDTAFTEIKGATWSSSTDTLEAIRDRGDAAWITATGGDATEAKQDAIITDLDDIKGTGFAKDTDSLTDLAHTGADSDTLETLSDQLDALAALSGGGAFTGTLTIDDGATGLQGVVVNARLGGVLQATGTTDVNGQITDWAFDANTFDLASQISGYQPSTDTLTVTANAWTKTVSLTLIAISPPPNAATTTGVMTVYDEEGSVESGVTITVQVIDGPGTAGIGYDSTEWAATSNGSGVVEFAGIILGARYKIWRGTSKPEAQTFTAPTTGTSFDLAEVIGRG